MSTLSPHLLKAQKIATAISNFLATNPTLDPNAPIADNTQHSLWPNYIIIDTKMYKINYDENTNTITLVG